MKAFVEVIARGFIEIDIEADALENEKKKLIKCPLDLDTFASEASVEIVEQDLLGSLQYDAVAVSDIDGDTGYHSDDAFPFIMSTCTCSHHRTSHGSKWCYGATPTGEPCECTEFVRRDLPA